MPFACNCKERQRQRAARMRCGGYHPSRNRFVVVAQLENSNGAAHHVLNDIHGNVAKKNSGVKVLQKLNKAEELNIQTDNSIEPNNLIGDKPCLDKKRKSEFDPLLPNLLPNKIPKIDGLEISTDILKEKGLF